MTIAVQAPDGRIFQIEYASKAVDSSGIAIGLQCTDGVVLGVEKLKLWYEEEIPRFLSKVGWRGTLTEMAERQRVDWQSKDPNDDDCRDLGCLVAILDLGASWEHLGSVLRASWSVLGASQ